MAIEQSIIKQAFIEENNDSAFWSLYISVIMIVLTFIITIFFATSSLKRTEEIIPILESKVGDMNLKGVFKEDSSELIEDSLSGIIFALKNHDLAAKITIFANSDGLALSKSMVVYREFLKSGVPANAANVYAQVENSDSDLKVEFRESRLE
ncbi:MAG: hypothetical protein SGJ02_03110 [bacterium]|nr:hypothetical protein [bacterium]